MTTINSVTDIKTWIQNSRPDVTGNDVDALIEAIQDAEHPAYGTDWAEWLSEFDYLSVLA